MSAQRVCPVVEAINAIRGGGIYKDDMEDDPSAIVRVGGVEYVMNDISYYISSRKIELARFELSRPTLQACKAKYKKTFAPLTGLTYSALRVHIIDRAIDRPFAYEAFINIVDLIGKIEELIIDVVATLARKGKPINISLPDMLFLPHIDRIIVYDPAAMEHTMNKIIEYINKLDVGSITDAPKLTQRIPNVARFIPPAAVDDMAHSTVVSPDTSTLSTPEDYIAAMKTISEAETHVTEYVSGIEKYHCVVVGHMQQVYDRCALLVDSLTGSRGKLEVLRS